MPRILYWLTGLFGAFLMIALLLLLKPTSESDSLIMRFDQASRCDEILGSISLNSQNISSLLNRPPIFSKGCWQTVTLPENNPAQDVKVNINNPHLLRVWYRVRYAVPDNWDVTKPLMVYI